VYVFLLIILPLLALMGAFVAMAFGAIHLTLVEQMLLWAMLLILMVSMVRNSSRVELTGRTIRCRRMFVAGLMEWDLAEIDRIDPFPLPDQLTALIQWEPRPGRHHEIHFRDGYVLDLAWDMRNVPALQNGIIQAYPRPAEPTASGGGSAQASDGAISESVAR